MTIDHLNEDDLVLHYYGELDTTDERRAAAHLEACADCRGEYGRLQRVMTAVDTLPDPVLPDGFERTVWARLEPALPPRRGWLPGLVLAPAALAWAAAIILLVAGAFFAGRLTQPQGDGSTAASAAQLREGVLLADVGEHLDRSQMMLVDLVTAETEDLVDISDERARAEELVAANRLYRQTAAASGEGHIMELLDELERLLVELAASPDRLSPAEMDDVRQRIDANGLLFKVRVLSSTVRERQKQQIRARAGQSS